MRTNRTSTYTRGQFSHSFRCQPVAKTKVIHMQSVLADSRGQNAARVVQLGDLGTGPTSGSVHAFEAARTFLEGFHVPYDLVTGNHDLEGPEFDTDADNLAAWQDTFQRRHHWVHDVGPCILVGLSTTRYRSNTLSHHEVHIDAEQRDWLEGVLADVGADKPAILFTHAPPMGCGLKVINSLHIKNRCVAGSSLPALPHAATVPSGAQACQRHVCRCAWLNHSGEADVFLDVVRRHPRIKAWFSGHFHLSHNYADSISVASGCAFVQVRAAVLC